MDLYPFVDPALSRGVDIGNGQRKEPLEDPLESLLLDPSLSLSFKELLLGAVSLVLDPDRMKDLPNQPELKWDQREQRVSHRVMHLSLRLLHHPEELTRPLELLGHDL